MFERDRSVRRRDALLVTPLLLGTVLAALISTAVMLIAWYLDVSTPVSLSAPSAHRANLIVSVGLVGGAWASVFLAICRDMILRRIDELAEHVSQTARDVTEHLTRTATDLVEHAEQSGVFRGIEIESERHQTEDGWVVPLPRPTDPERPDHPFRPK